MQLILFLTIFFLIFPTYTRFSIAYYTYFINL